MCYRAVRELVTDLEACAATASTLRAALGGRWLRYYEPSGPIRTPIPTVRQPILTAQSLSAPLRKQSR